MMGKKKMQRSQSADKLIMISKLTFDKYMKQLIRQGISLEQLRVQMEQYYGKENLLRQDLVKHLIARKDGDLSTIKEASIDASIKSIHSVNDERNNNHGVLLVNKLKRQMQFKSEAIDVGDHPAFNPLTKLLKRRHSADDLIGKPVSGFFKNDEIDND